ncbi:MAG: hypothetical protein U0794_13210 [Isosphaeraceae bacterium]
MSHVTGTNLTVTTDVSRCLQLLGNLVTSVLGATPPGGAIGLVASTSNKSWSVAIEGRSPPIGGQDSNFNEPEQTPTYLNRPAPDRWNGIQYAVCRELTARLGGRIEQHDEATTRGFVVRFPVHPDQVDF